MNITNLSSYYGIKSVVFDTDSDETAMKYANTFDTCTGNIGYRDLPEIISKHVVGNKALDYGCGTGYSTNLLKNIGFKVIGADISIHMLKEAKKNYQGIEFKKINHGNTMLPFNSFDLVLSTFVLFDIPSIKDVIVYLKEAKRILKPNGVFIACTGSEYFHLNNWLTEKIDIDKYREIKSGQTYMVHLINHDIKFYDYFYTHQDYLYAFNEVGLNFEQLYQPLGKKSDGIDWTTEWSTPPYSIYVCRS